MNLHDEFASILEKYGYPYLVVRASSNVFCSCYDEKTKSADVKCPICFGVGKTVVVEKHMCRELNLTTEDKGAKINEIKNYGEIGEIGRKFYFQKAANVQQGDLLVEVDWSKTGKPVWNGGGIYKVSIADKELFEKGEFIFYTVLTEKDPIEKEIRGIRISRAKDILNYEIAWKEENK